MQPQPCRRYPELTATDAHVTQYYMFYIHVAIMIYVGFGFLMTFLRCAAVTASWHTYLLFYVDPVGFGFLTALLRWSINQCVRCLEV